LEFAGEIAACGERARMWQQGVRVFGLVGGGAQAEFITIHERAVAEIPKNLSWSEAAAIPEVFITAHDALWLQAALRPGERVLIHAVGSGVGLAAVQLVRAMGAVPYGISRTAEKIHRAHEYGLEAGATINDPIAELPACTREWTNGAGFDAVLDLTGGPYVRAAVEALAPKGRLMLVGTVAGSSGEIPLGMVLGKRLAIRGTVMRARPLEERIATIRRFATEVVPLFERGVLRPTIDSEFPLEEIRAAHQRLESNETFGKVVVRVTS
jgi:NADPH:quinone reductase-like Zn-dependent oxidoreductase